MADEDGDKLKCFHCGSPGHKKKDCREPKNSAKPSQAPAAPAAPEAPCYICDDKKHQAAGCPVPAQLQAEFDKIAASAANSETVDRKRLVKLLGMCVRCLDYRGAVYIFDLMTAQGNSIDETLVAQLQKLNSIGGKDMSRVKVPMTERLRTAKVTLKTILKQHKVSNDLSEISSELPKAKEYIEKNMEAVQACANRFALATLLHNNCGLSSKRARNLAKYLADQGMVTQKAGASVVNLNATGAAAGGMQGDKADKAVAAAMAAKKRKRATKKAERQEQKAAEAAAAGESAGAAAAPSKPKISKKTNDTPSSSKKTDTPAAAAAPKAAKKAKTDATKQAKQKPAAPKTQSGALMTDDEPASAKAASKPSKSKKQ